MKYIDKASEKSALVFLKVIPWKSRIESHMDKTIGVLRILTQVRFSVPFFSPLIA